jgi:hypothetical protein
MPPPKNETEEQKEARLIKAKKNASKAREEAMIAKYKDKVLAKEKEKVKDESESEDEEAPKKPLKPSKEPKPIKEDKHSSTNVKEDKHSSDNEKEEVAEEKPKQKPKPKKAKAKVIIEQDSSDDEVFEASKDVIFVKRVRANKKVEQPPFTQQQVNLTQVRQQQPLPNQQQTISQQQQQQQPPPRPQMTPEKRIEMERYLAMTRGQFLPISRPR